MVPIQALLVAAATVGILHMSAPDHWVTLIILGRVSKWSTSRLLGVGIMTGLGHVGLSISLGFAVIGLGLAFSAQLSSDVELAIGALMVVGGVGYAIKVLRETNMEDYEKETLEELRKGEGRFGSRFRYFAVLGAALSPDVAILPIFLLAFPAGFELTIVTALVFGVASIGALSGFIVLGSAGLAKVFERIPPKYNDALVGLTIAAVGAYILLPA